MVKHTQTIRLSVFGHFVGLALKGLKATAESCFCYYSSYSIILFALICNQGLIQASKVFYSRLSASPICRQYFHFKNPENTTKQEVHWCFQGVSGVNTERKSTLRL